ncbi:MAG: DNA repair protein RadA, partial [Christensenellaceae bacterium]
MAKSKTQFVCSECGYVDVRWSGKCPGCASWNTMIEEAAPVKVAAAKQRVSAEPGKIYTFDKIPMMEEKRY